MARAYKNAFINDALTVTTTGTNTFSVSPTSQLSSVNLGQLAANGTINIVIGSELRVGARMLVRYQAAAAAQTTLTFGDGADAPVITASANAAVMTVELVLNSSRVFVASGPATTVA